MKRTPTTDEALRPEAARPTQTGKGREAGRRRNATRPRARSARGPQNKRDPARFMTAPQRARGACGHGGGSENRPRRPRTTRGRGVRVRERDLCTRSLKDDGRGAATPQRDELEAGPGRGPCPTTRGFARRLGRRANDQTITTSKARDRSGPALYKTRSRTRTPRPHQRAARLQDVGRRRGLNDNAREASFPLGPPSNGAAQDPTTWSVSGSFAWSRVDAEQRPRRQTPAEPSRAR